MGPDRRARLTAAALVILVVGALLGGLSSADTPVSLAQAASPVYLPVVQRALSVTPEVTPTATPEGALTVRGRVYDADAGVGQGVAGAVVSLLSCVGGRRETALSDADGYYVVTLPAPYAQPCGEVTLEAWADGYIEYTRVVSVAALRLDPVRNIPMWPAGDLVVTGEVFTGDVPTDDIRVEGATVTVVSCVDDAAFQDVTDAQGTFTIVVPAAYVEPCIWLTVRASAAGLAEHVRQETVQDLRVQSPYSIYLPPPTQPTIPPP